MMPSALDFGVTFTEGWGGVRADLKAWPKARNISTQHLATSLGTTSCIRLGTLLRYVATCWMMLDQI